METNRTNADLMRFIQGVCESLTPCFGFASLILSNFNTFFITFVDVGTKEHCVSLPASRSVTWRGKLTLFPWAIVFSSFKVRAEEGLPPHWACDCPAGRDPAFPSFPLPLSGVFQRFLGGHVGLILLPPSHLCIYSSLVPALRHRPPILVDF